MEKILILSRNEKIMADAQKILSGSYHVTVKKIPDNFSFFVSPENFLEEKDFKGIDLVLLDITDLDLRFDKESKQKSSDSLLVGQLQGSPVLKLLIADLDDSPYDKMAHIKFHDFVSAKSLQEELLVRAAILIQKARPLDPRETIAIGEMVIDLEKYELRVGPQAVDLTYKEFEFLKYLVLHEDKVVSRNHALSNIWGYDFYGGNRTVDVHVRRLRAKIPQPYGDMLKTIRNVGYMFSRKI